MKKEYSEETTTIAFRVPKSKIESVKKSVKKILDKARLTTPSPPSNH